MLKFRMNTNILQRININISKKCKHNQLKLRDAGNGLWMCVLVPAALLFSMENFSHCSESYKTTSIVSIGLFINSFCDMLHSNIPYIQIGYICSSTVVSLLLILFTGRGPVYSLFTACVTSLSYNWTLNKLIKSCPRSFTYGEITLISQSLILYLCSYFSNAILIFKVPVTKCDQIATFILQSGYFAVLIVLIAAFKCSQIMQYTIVFFIALCTSFLFFVISIPYFVLRRNPLFWLLELISTRLSIALIIFWILCCFGAVYCLIRQTKIQTQATSAVRKSFHFLMFLIMMPGLVLHPCLMYTASGIGFALLVVIEMCRKLNLSIYSTVLQTCFETFKDEKDEGEIALTPLYLMIGCAVPLWIFPCSFSKLIPLPVLSGIFSVAVGDAAASIGGSCFGKYRWQESRKTVEGTVCCFISQVILLWLINLSGFVQKHNFIWCCCVFAFTSVIEANTDQIDNLVLPFVTYILLSF